MDTENILRIIKSAEKDIGTPSKLLFYSALLLVLFATIIQTLDIDFVFIKKSTVTLSFAGLAILAFTIAFLMGLSHYIKKELNLNIGRGFMNGLLAGVIAGLVGGLIYAVSLISNPTPGDSFSHRLLRLPVTAFPIGAFYGLVLGFFRQSNSKFLKRRLSAGLIASIFIIVTVVYFAIPLAAEFPTLDNFFVPCWIIMIIISIYIGIMAGIEIWGHQTLKNEDPKVKIKILFYRELSLIFFLLALGAILFGFSYWIMNDGFFLLSFTFNPEHLATGLLVSMILLAWSFSGYLLFTWDNWLTKKLD